MVRNEGDGFAAFQASLPHGQAWAIRPCRHCTHGKRLTFESQQSSAKIFAIFSICEVNLLFSPLDTFCSITAHLKSLLGFTAAVLDGFEFQIARSAEATVLPDKWCCWERAELLYQCQKLLGSQAVLQMRSSLRLICCNSGLQVWNFMIYELFTTVGVRSSVWSYMELSFLGRWSTPAVPLKSCLGQQAAQELPPRVAVTELPCTQTPNHGTSRGVASCSPPANTSGHLTAGTVQKPAALATSYAVSALWCGQSRLPFHSSLVKKRARFVSERCWYFLCLSSLLN